MLRFTRILPTALFLAMPASLVGAQITPASMTPPQLKTPTPLLMPKMIERILPNGLRVIFVEQHELPLVDINLVVRTGPEADPKGKAGLATLTANMLDEGAGLLDALGIAEQIGYLAIRLNSGSGFEQSSVSLHTTRATLDSALALMADVVLRPTFPQKEFDRLKNDRLTALLQEVDRGPAIADRAFNAIVFGEDHPYGRSASGTREDAETITREDVQTFWNTWYRPNNATLVIVGDLTLADAMAKATSAFSRWTKGRLPVIARVAPTPARATRVYVVDKPKAPQTSFRIGGIGVARTTADYYPLMVMNTALGASFTSRLNNNLRETKGYTYGAGSNFSMRREPGAFTARAEIVAEKTDSALIEFMKELKGIRTPMPAAELAKSKRYLQLGYAEGFESTGDIAGQIAALVPYGIPLSTLGRFNGGIGAVTTADVQRVAMRYLDPGKLAIVVAGDRASILPALQALKIAPVEVRDGKGRGVVTP